MVESPIYERCSAVARIRIFQQYYVGLSSMYIRIGALTIQASRDWHVCKRCARAAGTRGVHVQRALEVCTCSGH